VTDSKAINSCVIGWPISHSRSPLIHGFWLQKYGIDGTYTKRAVEPENLASFFSSMKEKGLSGCNVTIPHKEQAAKLITNLDDRARRIGSVNTVYLQDSALHATSTDGEGFCRNIETALPDWSFQGKSILMIGAGGSSRAIADELLRRGANRIALANRTIAKAEQLRLVFGKQIEPIGLAEIGNHLPHCDLLVNTTSAGLAGASDIPVDLSRLREDAVVTDIVYTPLKTQLITNAENRGLRIVTGLGMLLHQAVRGFELWFGVKPVVTEELYTLIARDIDPGYQP
jgi:shikimate dehydrogenase